MYIVTGKTGSSHVTGPDDAAFNRGVLGAGDYILPNTTFSVTRTGTGTFQLSKADVSIDGAIGRIEGTETFTVSDGSSGMYRIDSIVATYSCDSTGIESMTCELLTGTEASTLAAAKEPTITAGDYYSGATKRQMRLVNITMYESSVQSYTIVAEYSHKLAELDVIGSQTAVEMASQSVSSGVWTRVASVSLEAGTYVIMEGALFALNATGIRGFQTTTTTTTPTGVTKCGFTANAVSGMVTSINQMRPRKLTATTTVNLWVYQTSGSTLTVNPVLYAYRIGL